MAKHLLLDRDYEFVSRREWMESFKELSNRNNECHDRYCDILEEGNKEEEVLNFCAERASELAEAEENNKNYVLLRESVEDGYSLYAIDFFGVPSLIPCTRAEFKAIYDKNGNVKNPSYLV